jgi:hypothetical protein
MKLGYRAQITFSLENRGAEYITFTGITVADARQSRIVASLGHGATTTLGSVPLAPGEDLPLDGESLWIEVDGLTRKLSAGGRIQAILHFGTATFPISIPVDIERSWVSPTGPGSIHEPTS